MTFLSHAMGLNDMNNSQPPDIKKGAVYKNSDNGKHYKYNDGRWELMTIQYCHEVTGDCGRE